MNQPAEPGKKSNPRKTETGLAASVVAAIVIQACAGNPLPGSTQSSQSLSDAAAAGAIGARINFHHSDYHSLTSPDPNTNCAGDAKQLYFPLDYRQSNGETLASLGSSASSYAGPSAYYAAIGSTGAVPFSNNVLDPSYSSKPSFLRNVSVDLTDANSPLSVNQAYSCSFGDGGSVPPPSSCATFDYGVLGGVSSTLGGTLTILGGTFHGSYAAYYPTSLSAYQGTSVSCGPVMPNLVGPTGLTDCSTSMYALGVDTLPGSAATTGPSPLAPGLYQSGATGSISSWANLAVSGYSGPQGVAGAVAAYSPGAQKILLFSGSSPLAGSSAIGAASDTTYTWSYDLKTQKWSYLNSTPFVSNSMLRMPDLDTSGFLYQISKSPGGRALFGYAAVPAFALGGMSTTGLMAPTGGADAPLDITDRIVIAGGLGFDADSSRNTFRFNPTFGPEWIDTVRRKDVTLGAGSLVQWMDSYHTQVINNYQMWSQYRPDFLPTAAPTGALAFNFGFAPVRKIENGNTYAGYAVAAGGFDLGISNIAQAATGGTGSQGRMFYTGSTGGVPEPETYTSNFVRAANSPTGARLTEMSWIKFTEGGTAATQVPWYGGTSLVTGLSLSTNDLAYFGGTSCRDYLTDTTLSSTACDFSNPGRYWSMGPTGFTSASTALPSATVGWNGTNPPYRAGMANARGEDGDGNVIIVAWGGMSAPVTATDDTIYVLYDSDAGAAVAPRWVALAPTAGDKPVPLTNSALVYSHVTRKFYLFGGHQTAGTVTTLGDTWELSTSGTCPACTFTWKKLNTAGGLTCFPQCPQARRSHRMVEANYSYSATTTDSTTLEPYCLSSTAPCSFGIFMEGGSPDGYTQLGDRWMLDPTANGGRGHWQRVDGFPPRHLAAMTSIDYFVPSQNSTVHRAVMFGGETSLHSPQMAAVSPTGATRYFVPPTLGDTYIYDLDNNTWNRMEILGKGYLTSIPHATLTELEKRQAYAVNTATGFFSFYDPTNPTLFSYPEIAELSPPPLSGAVMVTRTYPRGLKDSNTSTEPLDLPEIFLFGGRKKDGSFNTIDRVYKLCLGSTGERPAASVADDDDSGACDAYDSSTNASSPNPVIGYVGRWLRKRPNASLPADAPVGADFNVTPSDTKSFMGAAVYDSYYDKIVLYGGIGGETAANTAVTKTPQEVASKIYEYTPPSKSYSADPNDYQLHGYWRAIPSCSGYPEAATPTGRFGHSMGYDPLNRQIIVTGGYDVNGNPLVQTQTYYDGRTYEMPEVWTAKRVDVAGSLGPDGPTIPAASPLPCYHWARKTLFGNSIDVASQAPPQKGIGHGAAVFIPGTGYNTGYYTFTDNACAKAGPIASSDPEVSKLMAGGAYIDLDRSALGPNENLLLNLTYLPLGTSHLRPDGKKHSKSESAIIRVHLIQTAQSAAEIRQTYQPRHLTYTTATQLYPRIVQTLSVLAPISGEGNVRQEQVLIPLASDPDIDRIRIERYSGSAILIDATIYRMGYR